MPSRVLSWDVRRLCANPILAPRGRRWQGRTKHCRVRGERIVARRLSAAKVVVGGRDITPRVPRGRATQLRETVPQPEVLLLLPPVFPCDRRLLPIADRIADLFFAAVINCPAMVHWLKLGVQVGERFRGADEQRAVGR